MTKAELRKLYLEKRRSLTSGERSELSRRITEHLFAALELGRLTAIHCFISISHNAEVETRGIFEKLWAEYPVIRTYVPRIDAEKGTMESVEFNAGSRVAENEWKVPEPIDGATGAPAEIDAVIIPLLAFDIEGNRVGYGKGFYDRFLSECRPDCLKIGLSFFEPVERIADAHAGDVRLDSCVTPGGTIAFK